MFSSPGLNLQYLTSAFGLANVIAAAFTILVVVVNVIIYKLREFSEHDNHHIHEKNTTSTSPTEQQCLRFSLAEIKSATQDFREGLVVGKGGFGKVYKGFIKNREEVVAVKRLNSGSKQGENEFWMEIETLSRLRHLHLVSLIGYCNEGNERILVYEYMPGGTLVDHLYKTKAADHTLLSWEKRLEICIGAARGLDYLHTGTAPGVIHRDVKDSNILLDDKLVAKIADFGLAKLENIDPLQSHVSTNVKGTFGYMDPEYFLTRRVSKKTDVYAFGVVLLVVLSGRAAVDMRVEDDRHSLVLWAKKCIEEGRVDQIIDPCLKLEIQSNGSLKEFFEVVKNCLHKQPKERPSMEQVVAHLELALEHQQGTLGSTMPLEVNDNLTTPFVDLMYHEGSTRSSSGDLSITMPTSWVSISPLKESSKQRGEGDSTSPKLERSKNEHNTQQKSAWKWLWEGFQKRGNSYKSQNIVCSDEDAEVSRTDSSSEPNIRTFSFSELKAATKNFRHDHLIGQGSGSTYKGWLVGTGSSNKRSRYLVAINRRNSGSFLTLKELQEQVLLLRKLTHPNLMNLLGYCFENDELLYVHEFMRKGSLDNNLYGRASAVLTLPWDLRLKICCDAARGLAFLHSSVIPIIHRDFQSSKILLDESYNAKVIGFRLAVYGPTGSETHVSTRVMGTTGHAAPEYMATGHLNVKTDVYAFGVVLVEILTGLRLFDALRRTEHHNIIDWANAYLFNKRKLRRIMDSRLEGQYHPGAAVQVAQLALKCLSAQPKMRPLMQEVLGTLEHIQSINHKT